MVSSRILAFGLGAAALLSFAAARPASAGSTNDNYTVSFTTPTAFLGTGNGDIQFGFNPDGPNPAQASVTGSGLTYSSDWKVNPFGISTYGDASFNFFSQSVTIKNTDPRNGFTLPVTNWGSTFGFNLNYQDPPGKDPSDFVLVLQKTGQADVSLFDIRFDPAGTAYLVSAAPGVSIQAQDGTPPLGTNPVPEASTTVSLGLLLVLGLGAAVVKKKTTAQASA